MKMLLPVLLMLATGKTMLSGEIKVKTLPLESREVLDCLPQNIVIAHRGTTYWAPEETDAAMRWARNIGADYLELDLRRTKDGVLIALHDVNLRRTTNVETVFPDRADSPVSEFTLEELRQLDAGSWFNKVNPDRARKAFEGLDILTLEDVVRIAEGYRIVRDRAGKREYDIDGQGRKHTRYEKDPDDNGNRPDIYPEAKEPHLFPGMAIHPYSFDTGEQMEEYTGLKAGQPAQNRADGMFTNKSDMTIRFYQETLPAKYLKSNATSGLPDHLQQKKKL